MKRQLGGGLRHYWLWQQMTNEKMPGKRRWPEGVEETLFVGEFIMTKMTLSIRCLAKLIQTQKALKAKEQRCQCLTNMVRKLVKEKRPNYKPKQKRKQ
ncbi:unnamed protein product [Cylicostephanus goldi]|uniref:Uncharacterized protein n=1 Tax=Cylicostephanus goldi TaxID=71465 RepID=A0A3P6T470_CYLGO|nr:unnamed protein product [Cylicostephanus goldi]